MGGQGKGVHYIPNTQVIEALSTPSLSFHLSQSLRLEMDRDMRTHFPFPLFSFLISLLFLLLEIQILGNKRLLETEDVSVRKLWSVPSLSSLRSLFPCHLLSLLMIIDFYILEM